MQNTGKRESEQEILKKEKNKVAKNLLQGESNPDPQNQLELKVNASTHWPTSVNTVYSFSTVIGSFQG